MQKRQLSALKHTGRMEKTGGDFLEKAPRTQRIFRGGQRMKQLRLNKI